jgi:hypothetical protein
MDEIKRNGTLHLKTRKQTYIKSAIVVMTLLLTSCVPSGSGGKKRSSGASGISNSPSSVAVGYGRILHDNPIILSGNASLSEDVNLSTLLKPSQDFITNSQDLSNKNCQRLSSSDDTCFSVARDELSEPIQATNGKWAYAPESYEFMQVQMFANMNSMFNKYNTDLKNYQSMVNIGSLDTSFKTNTLTNNEHWFQEKVVGYAHCEDSADNAFFSPSKKIICLGYDSIFTQVKFVHDPTVLYHELGHALVLAGLNVRNKNLSQIISTEAYLGYFAYDEAKSINEGLADYFSYYMNGRPFLGEWAFGRFLELGRPMAESDPLHAPGISETNEGRLSYPTFLSYNPNTPTQKDEDVHYAGQIISHFLVAFTKDIQNRCNYPNDSARSLTVSLILETLAYLGDLSSTGLKDETLEGRVNHSEIYSRDWLKANKPITYRRFAQTFSRFVNSSIIQSPTICSNYTEDHLEVLLDSYGLLLFKNYDFNGSLFKTSETIKKVNPVNRQKTVLIKKNQLFVDNRQNAAKAYIFDGYEDMNGAASSISDGLVETTLSPTIFENGNLKYNNGNSQISPGELVGVLLNLYNNSNSDMAGVRILANDWNHMDGSSPCNNLSDNFPSESQGGVTIASNPDCGVEYPTAPDTLNFAPVCFMQDSKDNGTVWVSQEEFMNSRAIEATECLGGSQNTKDCLVRAPKGADVAWYSKIEPKKTWNETFTDANGKVKFKSSNLFFLEISPSIPPGTTVNCRLRATFTNCDDCNNYLKAGNDPTNVTGNDYTLHINSSKEVQGDEYKDYKYNGADPFVIINYQFTVID